MAKEDGVPEFRGELGRLRRGGGGKSESEDELGHAPHYSLGPGAASRPVRLSLESLIIPEEVLF